MGYSQSKTWFNNENASGEEELVPVFSRLPPASHQSYRGPPPPPPFFWANHILQHTSILRKNIYSITLPPWVPTFPDPRLDDGSKVLNPDLQRIYDICHDFLAVEDKAPNLAYTLIWLDPEIAMRSFTTKLEYTSIKLGWAGCDALRGNSLAYTSSPPLGHIDGYLDWKGPRSAMVNENDQENESATTTLANRNKTYQFQFT